MRKGTLTAVTLVFLMSAAMLHAQTIDEVLANVRAAGGGEAVRLSLNSMKMTGKVEVPMQGIELTMVMYTKRPNKTRQDLDFQGMQIINACDGETAWTINPMVSTDPTVLEGEQAAAALRRSDFDGPLYDMEKKGIKAELVGTEKEGDKDLVHVKLTYADGFETHNYYDPTTWLAYKTVATQETQMGPQEITTYMSEYKTFGNVPTPTKIEQKMGEMVVAIVSMENVELNVEIDDSLFSMPKGE